MDEAGGGHFFAAQYADDGAVRAFESLPDHNVPAPGQWLAAFAEALAASRAPPA
jgi:hypothetical protein